MTGSKCILVCALISVLMCVESIGLELKDFEAIARKWNTGEAATNSQQGIVATPAPVRNGGVNFLNHDYVFPLFIETPLPADGSIAFGLVNRTAWTPTDGDGKDLVTSDDIGDRVYTRLNSDGTVVLISAPHLGSGTVIATNRIAPSSTSGFIFHLDERRNVATVYYGDKIVLEGIPFGGNGLANRTNIGKDFAISAGCECSSGTESIAYTFNHFPTGAHIKLARPPVVLAEETGRSRLTPDELFFPRGHAVLLSTQTADLAIYLENVGSEASGELTARLIPPTGSGLTTVGTDRASFGRIPGRTATFRTFRLRTENTPVGIHHLTLELQGALPQTVTVPIVVWKIEPQIIDLSAGKIQVAGESPLETYQVEIEAPEVRDFNVFPYKFYFDLKQIKARIVQRVPFYGVHRGDPFIGAPVFVAASPAVPLAKLSERTVTLTVQIKDSNNNPIPRIGVILDIQIPGGGNYPAEARADNGSVTFEELPPGHYRIRIVALSDGSLLKDGEKDLGFLEPGRYTIQVCYPATPPAASNGPGPETPTANAQGNSGTPAGAPAPSVPVPVSAPPPPAPTPAAPPEIVIPPQTGRSIGVGVMTAVGLEAADLAGLIVAGPSGPGAVFAALCLSGLAAELGGGAAGWAADPANQDLVFVARENTRPVDEDERTLEESLVVNVGIAPPLSTTAASVISSQFQYTRTTDRRTYSFSGSENITDKSSLFLDVVSTRTNLAAGAPFEVIAKVSTLDGSALRAADVLIKGFLVDSSGSLGTALFGDDGQLPDLLERDGEFRAVLTPGRTISGTPELYLIAVRSGFFNEHVPPSFGMKALRLAGTPPVIRITRQAGEIVLSWNTPAVLEEADRLDGMWRSIPAAVNSFTTRSGERQKYYRLRLQ